MRRGSRAGIPTAKSRQVRAMPATDARKTRALILLASERLPLGELAHRLGVSEVTAKRLIGTLRKAGEEIVSVRAGKEAYYELRDPRTWSELKGDPLLTTVVPVRATRYPRGKPEDADYDRD